MEKNNTKERLELIEKLLEAVNSKEEYEYLLREREALLSLMLNRAERRCRKKMEEQQELVIGQLDSLTERQQNYILDLIEYDVFSEEETAAPRPRLVCGLPEAHVVYDRGVDTKSGGQLEYGLFLVEG